MSLALALAVLLVAPSAAQAPSPAFRLQPPARCVAGTCSVTLSYDAAGLLAPVTIEIDWDHRGPASEGFAADDALECPEDVGACTARSPVYDEAGETSVAVRVTDLAGLHVFGSHPLLVLPARTRVPPSSGEDPAVDLCAPRQPNVSCGPGNGRRTRGGGDKVSHKGWPPVTGILWKVLDSTGRKKAGGPDNDELLGHHGSDHLDGRGGKDILWGDWNPRDNNTRQRDVLIGGEGNDFIYPSHGTTTVKAGPGQDYVWAFYGRGVIDCGPGRDRARVRLETRFRVRNCETIGHFCAFGPDGKGGCLKPGEKRATPSRRVAGP